MKKHFHQFLREHFSFSKRETRGMLVLAGILFCLLGTRLAMPYLVQNHTRLEQSLWAEQVRFLEAEQIRHQAEHAPRTQAWKPGTVSYFPFDPNELDSAGFQSLGIRPWHISSLLKFRDRGGRFREPEDLKKLFFMNDSLFTLLEPWIRIAEQPDNKTTKKHRPVAARPDLNSCDSVALVRIRGIGPYTASKVIRYRDWLGGFVSFDQLHEIKGLKSAQIDTLQARCVLEPIIVRKIPLNTATEAELQQHPYIRYKARVLVRYRQEHGPYRSPEDLLKTGVISDSLLQKLELYILWE